jgi:hypothetical protein
MTSRGRPGRFLGERIPIFRVDIPDGVYRLPTIKIKRGLYRWTKFHQRKEVIAWLLLEEFFFSFS